MEATIELREALLANKEGVTAALNHAQAELDALRLRSSELQDLIVRARLVLGLEAGPKSVADPTPPLTLHRAMEEVLRSHPDGLAAAALAQEITRRGLYRRRDGGPVDSGQIHARTNAYASIFERRDGRITLRGQRQ